MKPSIYWRETAAPGPADPLERDTEADIVIIGGGMTGLSAAQWLIERGEKGVVLLEAEHCGAGASGHNSGSIIPVAVQDLHQLLYRFGAVEGRRLAHAVTDGLRTIRETVRNHDIDCGLIDADTLHTGTISLFAQQVGKEHEARVSLGLPSRLYRADELPGMIGTDIFRAGAAFGGSFGINSYRYLLGLRDALKERSLRVYENTRVCRIEAGRVITARAAVRCRKVIVCVDRLAPQLEIGNSVIHHQQHFIAVSEPLDERTRRSLFPDRPLIVHALARHYHYLRLTPEGRLVLGGMPLRRAYARRPRDPLPDAAREIDMAREWYPALRGARFTHGWSGLFGLTRDLMPLAGEVHGENGRRFAAGCGGSMVWSLLAGRTAAEAAVVGSAPLLRYFDPARHRTPLDPLLRVLPQGASFPLANAYARTLQKGDFRSVSRQRAWVGAGVALLAAAPLFLLGRKLLRSWRSRDSG